MTKYEELASFAIEQTKKEMLHRCDCKDAARTVVSRFLEFLQCPRAAMRWLKFHRNGRLEQVEVIELTAGDTDFYEFGFSITFRNESNVFVATDMHFGIKKQGLDFVLRAGDKDTTFDPTSEQQLAALNEDLFENFKRAFIWPDAGPKRPFGFHPRGQPL